MAYSNFDVAHRWANGIGYNQGSNMHATETNLYSYSTVIAQCLDRERNVFVVIDESLTPTTSKHVSYARRAIPNYAHVFQTHIDGGYHWDNVDFLGWKGKFNQQTRLQMVSHFVSKAFEEYEKTREGKSLDSENIDITPFVDAERLNDLYGDCSLKTWLRRCKTADNKHRKLVRLYLDDKHNEEIADALFGNGTWARLQERIAPLKKAQRTREKIEHLRVYLGFQPSDAHWDDIRPQCPYTAKELRKMSARDRLAIKFLNLSVVKTRKYRQAVFGNAYDTHKTRTQRNALKFLGITSGCSDVHEVSLPDGTVIYSGRGDWWDDYHLSLDYDAFMLSVDKRKFRERFWKLASLKMRRIQGYKLFTNRYYAQMRGETFEMTEEENHIYNEFVVRKNRYEAERELRDKREAERRARQMQEKMEKIEAYKSQGVDGVRRLWIERLESVPCEILDSPQLCYGGNILMRFDRQDGYVETSKHIRLSFEQCHKYWAIIKKWHDTGTFKEGVSMAGYQVRSFNNDILVAGCHQIAFCEMERMYNELCARERETA